MSSFRVCKELLLLSRGVGAVAGRLKGPEVVSKLRGGEKLRLQLFCRNTPRHLHTRALGVFHSQVRMFTTGTPRELDELAFHKLSDATLDELAEFFEDLGDSGLCSDDYDVSLASGVLTINLGDHHGTYVINKQSPNKQIWFSSPKSGPKRFDVIDGRWRYSHDGVALHDLLQQEMSEVLDTEIDLSQLPHSHLLSDGDSWLN